MSDFRQRLDEIFRRFDRTDGPGVTVGVAHRGTTVYRAAFGLASVEHRVALTPASRMALSSVTKHMTCAAVLQLAHEGRLSLDDRLGHWFPELHASMHAPTLRQLMAHTGGIRCHFDTGAFNGLVSQPVGMPLKIMLRQRTINFEPGHGMMYCNGGYVLLSLAIERASGLPFERYMSERLFAPLRMDATDAPRYPTPVRADVATHYVPEPAGGWRHGLALEDETLGNGSAYSTVDDMLAWAQYLRTSGGPVSLKALAQEVRFASGVSSTYRYGLIDNEWRGLRVVEHGGGAMGTSCHFMMLPDEALDVIVFSNGGDDAQGLAREAAAIVLGERLGNASPHGGIDVEPYRALLGTWLDPTAGVVFGLADAAGQLAVSSYGGPAVPMLQPCTPGAGELPFTVASLAGSRRFKFEPDGGLAWFEEGVWRRLVRVPLSPVDLEELVGGLGGASFKSDEAMAALRFDGDDGELRMTSCGDWGRWTFHPRSLNRDLLVFSFYKGVGSWLARLAWRGDQVQSIEMSSTRTRHLRFEREA